MLAVALREGSDFRKSSYSVYKGKCVEARYVDDSIIVRHSVFTETQIQFSTSEWEAFIEGVKAGEFDLVIHQ